MSFNDGALLDYGGFQVPIGVGMCVGEGLTGVMVGVGAWVFSGVLVAVLGRGVKVWDG